MDERTVYRMSEKEKLKWLVEIGVERIEFFREFCGLSDEAFVGYMNKYNIWKYVCDFSFMHGALHWDVDKWINFLGAGFSIEQKYAMLMRYKQKYPDIETFDGR